MIDNDIIQNDNNDDIDEDANKNIRIVKKRSNRIKNKKEDNNEVEKESIKEVNIIKNLNNYWNSRVVANKKELADIGESALLMFNNKFHINIPLKFHLMASLVFKAALESVIDYLYSQQKKYSEYSLALMSNIHIGYLNNENADNENIGNFQAFIEHLGENKFPEETIKFTYDVQTTPKSTIISNIINDYIRINMDFQNLQVLTANIHQLIKCWLGDIKFQLPSNVYWALFGEFYESMLNYMHIKSSTESHVSLNVFGIFQIHMVDADIANYRDKYVYMEPLFSMKLGCKNDSNALTLAEKKINKSEV